MEAVPAIALLPKPTVEPQQRIIVGNDAVGWEAGDVAVPDAALPSHVFRIRISGGGGVARAVVLMETHLRAVADLGVNERGIECGEFAVALCDPRADVLRECGEFGKTRAQVRARIGLARGVDAQ